MTAHAARKSPAALILNPTVRVLWRSATTIQLELGERAVVLTGLNESVLRRLVGYRATSTRSSAAAPGSRGAPAIRADSAALAQIIEPLRSQGFLVRRDDRPPVHQPRLAPDLAALRARHGDDAAALMRHRGDAAVVVHGTTRVATVLASLLGAAGIGRVSIVGDGDVRLHQAAPGGLSAADEGHRFRGAAAAALLRAAPDCDTRELAPDVDADLVVLAGGGPVDTQLRDALHRRGLAHLYVDAPAERALVGPLVVPGWFSCLHCADLHRLDRDPAWSALAVQLESPRRYPDPSDVALAAFAASVAALQALAYLDGELPGTVEGTLELHPPDWRIRRRSWPAHPECGCGASH